MAEKKHKDYVDMTVQELTKLMAGPSPIRRKNAAKELVERVKAKPEKFKKNIPDFIDALARPEAQTRWLALDSLSYLVPVDTKACKAAIEGAEEALFDEKTALIRESAIRFLSRYGATSMQRSKEVWPLIKDALQQYHGEIDYDRMLNRVTFFASGKLDSAVKKDFRAVVKDIMNSVGGPTKARLNRILLALKGQKVTRSTITKKVEKKPEVKKEAKKKPVAKKAAQKKTSAKKTSDPKKKDIKKKVDAKKKDIKKKVVKKAVKSAVAKPKAKTKVVKKVENKKKKVAKKVVKKAVKKAIKKDIKKADKKVAKKKPATKKKVAAKKTAPKKSKKK